MGSNLNVVAKLKYYSIINYKKYNRYCFDYHSLLFLKEKKEDPIKVESLI